MREPVISLLILLRQWWPCKGLTPKASVQWPLAEDDPGFDDLEARRLALPTRRLASKTSLHLGALHCDLLAGTG